MVLVVVILETVYPIFEFVAFEIDVDDETETVLAQTVGGGVAFDMEFAAADDVDVGPAAAS